MKTNELISAIDEMFPPLLQESYDNAGKQIVFNDQEVSAVLLALDISNEIIEEAIKKRANFIISHHPVIFRPIRNIVSSEPKSDLLLKSIEKRISIYAAHTNLDKIYFNKLGDHLGLNGKGVLFPEGCMADSLKLAGTDLGLGYMTQYEGKATLAEFVDMVKKTLNIDHVIYTGDLDQKILNVAVVNGSGGGVVEKIITHHDVDCILTGDIGYHHAHFAQLSGVALVDAGHFGTERVLLDFLLKDLQDFLTKKMDKADLEIFISESEKNPLKVY